MSDRFEVRNFGLMVSAKGHDHEFSCAVIDTATTHNYSIKVRFFRTLAQAEGWARVSNSNHERNCRQHQGVTQ